MSQSLPLFRAFQLEVNGVKIFETELSQSLPLFRAFQQEVLSRVQETAESQSLPLFRAFQQDELFEQNNTQSRNPFHFLGHFNTGLAKEIERRIACRNPFHFLGHFNKRGMLHG